MAVREVRVSEDDSARPEDLTRSLNALQRKVEDEYGVVLSLQREDRWIDAVTGRYGGERVLRPRRNASKTRRRKHDN